jgi:hypothetical protein
VNPTAVLRLGLWGALSIAMMTVDHRYHALDGVRDVLATAIYPLHLLMRLPITAENWLTENGPVAACCWRKMPNCAKNRFFSTFSCRS